ncbi:hypothetical protein [Bacillus sp. 1P06AnD]|uniref:hypothetical protein n=1 Tax=Bacillus sp. 1P06AnD TaxID=3132208 RepID=UPI0039A36D46
MKKWLASFMIFLFAILSIASPVFAEKGDFYKKHESDFEDKGFSKSQIKFIKAFDSETNSFDCGFTDLSCHINAFQYEPVIGITNVIAEGTKLLVLEPDLIVKDEKFQQYKKALSSLSYTMLTIFLLWQIMAAVAKRLGSPDDLPETYNDKLLKTIVCTIFLALYTPIFDYILNIQNLAVSSLLDAGLSKDDLLMMIFVNSPNYSIAFTLVIGLVNIVFLIALVYRFCLFGFLYVVGPIAIPTGVNEEYDYFSLWLRLIINNVVTLFCQSLMFMLGMAALTGQLGFVQSLPRISTPIVGFFLSLVFLFLALVIPSMLGGLGASTGTGRSMGKVVRYLAYKK